MTAPDWSARLPAPVWSTVPPFSSMRPLRVTPNVLAKVSVALDSTMVRPLPLMVPAVQRKAARMVSDPLPVKVGLEAPLKVTWAQSAAVFKVTVAELVMTTLSFKPGARLGVQLVAVSQSPLVALVQRKSMGVKRAKTVLLLVITSVTGLLRVTMSPSQA